MSEPESVHWNLLPQDPEGFFGLSGDVDRKDLKRRYNALIRQFKPEKHPEEFQKIREAYEELDNRLRYGERSTRSASAAPEFDWQKTVREVTQASTARGGSEPAGRSKPAADKPASQVLIERLQTEPVVDVYRDLKAVSQRTPYDFFALAVLSDVAQPDDPLAFPRWLLKGLKDHPADAGLQRLLSSYLRSRVPLKLAARIVQLVAQEVPNDRFYFLTEPLWDRLINAAPFEKVADLLAQCEQHIRDHRIAGRLTFYAHLLRKAVWVADRRWLKKALEFVEEHAEEMGGSLDYDLEFVRFLRGYLQRRDEFLNGTEGRRLIDQAMQDYCFLSGPEADRKVLECQIALATDPQLLVDAFVDPSEEYPDWFTLWRWISADVGERAGGVEEETDPSRLYKQLRAVVRQADEATGGTWLRIKWLLMESFATPVFALILIVVVTLAVSIITGLSVLESGPAGSIAAILVSLGIIGYAFGWYYPRVFKPWRTRKIVDLTQQCYREIWQPRMVQHLTMTHHPYGLLLEHLEKIANTFDAGYSAWIYRYLAADYGMILLSLALRFLK